MTGALRIAARNLSRNRRRNAATGAAVALGFAGLVLLSGYILRVERFLRTTTVYLQHLGHVSVWKTGGLDFAAVKPKKYSLSVEEQAAVLAALAADPDVELAGRFLVTMGLAGNGCRTVPFVGVGIEPDVDRRIRFHPEVRGVTPELAMPKRGRELAAYDASLSPVSLSTGLARLLGKRSIHDELSPATAARSVLDCAAPDVDRQVAVDANVQLAGGTFDGSFSAVDGEVVSVFSTGRDQTEESTLLAPLDLMQRLHDTDRVTYVAAFIKDAWKTREVAARIALALASRGLAVEVHRFDEEEVSPFYIGSLGILMVIAGFIGTVVFAVVALSILNSMTMTVLERTREIGTFRSLGFTRKEIAGLFLREAALLIALGLAAGLALALATAGVVNAVNIRFSPPGVPGTVQFLLEPHAWVSLALAALTALVGLAATWLAVRGRTRQRVAELNVEVAA